MKYSSLQHVSPNQLGLLANLPGNNMNSVYAPFPVYRNMPYPMSNVVNPLGVYRNMAYPLKALGKAYLTQRLQAAAGQVNSIHK